MTSRSTDQCGETRILTCAEKSPNTLLITPNITWYHFSRVPVLATGNPRTNRSLGQLIFHDIDANNSEEYTCHLSLDIPVEGIQDYYNETSVIVTENGKAIYY